MCGALVEQPVRPADWTGCWPLLQAMGQVDAAAARQRVARVLTNPPEFLPVVEQDGVLVGYAWAHQIPLHLRAGRSTVRMNDMFVTPTWRRQRQQLHHLRSIPSRRNAESVTIMHGWQWRSSSGRWQISIRDGVAHPTAKTDTDS